MRVDFFFALEDLLENADEVDEGDDQFALGAFVVVQGFVGLGPDVLFDLLALVEELRGVFEFFVFDRGAGRVLREGRRPDLRGRRADREGEAFWI